MAALGSPGGEHPKRPNHYERDIPSDRNVFAKPSKRTRAEEEEAANLTALASVPRLSRDQVHKQGRAIGATIIRQEADLLPAAEAVLRLLPEDAEDRRRFIQRVNGNEEFRLTEAMCTRCLIYMGTGSKRFAHVSQTHADPDRLPL